MTLRPRPSRDDLDPGVTFEGFAPGPKMPSRCFLQKICGREDTGAGRPARDEKPGGDSDVWRAVWLKESRPHFVGAGSTSYGEVTPTAATKHVR